jgi:hypothetical protein
MKTVLRPESKMDVILKAEAQQQQQVKDQARYDTAYARWQERSAREDAGRQMRGLNSLPPPEKPRTGLGPGGVGKDQALLNGLAVG